MNAGPSLPVESRPRVEGDRELQILQATLEVLGDVGYDRLTMDAVATRAKASKATLYRRWNTKAALVIDAIVAHKGPNHVPDTGSLRGDLLATSCGSGGFTDPQPISVLGSIMTAINRDADFAEAWRRDFIGPKIASSRAIYERARARGEIRDDLDIDLIAGAFAGIILHRIFVLGEPASADSIANVIDQIVLPACRPTDPR
ncbi:TetR/AcrR family transcriptional regulator [Nocardioides sp.]|uniref:TetR/AcrR family transcriptional regulator n=1 Tax=Nocardioides sp. TaxID=35761 RepID=UPI003D0C195C